MAERLRDARSRYLATAAESPIDWHPWTDDAFRRAREEDKPILLDIGAVWCHWCHVMDHGTYEDPEVVRRLNQDFVCVKVDRDERPDVDVRYQRAVGAITGQGGWPLTAFLTPDGRVFFGGTYFPPQDAHGRPGFRSVLEQITEVWRNDRPRVESSAAHITDALRARLRETPAPAALDVKVLDAVARTLVHEHDPKFGGFGRQPKFPHTGAIAIALTLFQRTGEEQLDRVAQRTLDKMADGGIHDRVAGGFHRYSVDAHWTVPHFEKMAYDNAELLRAYAYAFAVTGRPLYRSTAEGIVRFALETGADRERGGFAASQDADIAPDDDGDHFTWTLGELRQAMEAGGIGHALSSETLYEIARRRFGVEARGDMHHDPARNVLEVEASYDEVATALDLGLDTMKEAEPEILRRLAAARAQRVIPFIDTTRFTDWNAMMASAFLEADAYLGLPEARRHALRTLDRLVEESWDERKGWLHRPRQDGGDQVNGLFDDQTWMGLALVDAYRFAGRRDLLDRAVQTAGLLLTHWRSDGPALVDTAPWVRESAAAAPLQDANRPYLDQSAPGANPVAARFLMRLGRALDEPRYVDAAREILEAFAEEAPKMGIFAATWFQAVEELLSEPPHVTVLGASDDPATAHLLDAARGTPRPGVVVTHVEPGAPETAPAYLRETVSNEDLVKDGAKALVCYGSRCDLLTDDPNLVRAKVLDFTAGPRPG